MIVAQSFSGFMICICVLIIIRFSHQNRHLNDLKDIKVSQQKNTPLLSNVYLSKQVLYGMYKNVLPVCSGCVNMYSDDCRTVVEVKVQHGIMSLCFFIVIMSKKHLNIYNPND